MLVTIPPCASRDAHFKKSESSITDLVEACTTRRSPWYWSWMKVTISLLCYLLHQLTRQCKDRCPVKNLPSIGMEEAKCSLASWDHTPRKWFDSGRAGKDLDAASQSAMSRLIPYSSPSHLVSKFSTSSVVALGARVGWLDGESKLERFEIDGRCSGAIWVVWDPEICTATAKWMKDTNNTTLCMDVDHLIWACQRNLPHDTLPKSQIIGRNEPRSLLAEIPALHIPCFNPHLGDVWHTCRFSRLVGGRALVSCWPTKRISRTPWMEQTWFRCASPWALSMIGTGWFPPLPATEADSVRNSWSAWRALFVFWYLLDYASVRLLTRWFKIGLSFSTLPIPMLPHL